MSETVRTFDVKYELGHSYSETWQRSADLHCPNCGKREVWEELGPGDVYVGPGLMCSACGASWTMQGPDVRSGSLQDQQRLEQFRAARPTTEESRDDE